MFAQEKHLSYPFFILAGMLLVILSACMAQSISPPSVSGKLNVVATTTILGDVVRQVSGDTVNLTVLLPAGADPHIFEPTPQDMSTIAKANLVFVNGAGLEAFLERLIESASEEKGKGKLILVSEGVQLRQMAEEGQPEAQAGKSEEVTDPHVWFNPNHVIIWTDNIEQALKEIDPSNAGVYAANAKTYRQELKELDAWIEEQVAQIPQAHRKLVSDHDSLGYLADRYGFEQVGAVIPSFSTAAEPSAQELASLEEAIRDLDVRAIFAGTTVNPSLAQRIAEDTGIQLVLLYTGSLTGPGGEAESYVEFMHYDITAIVEALK